MRIKIIIAICVLFLMYMPIYSQNIAIQEVICKNNYWILVAVGLAMLLLGYFIGCKFPVSRRGAQTVSRSKIEKEFNNQQDSFQSIINDDEANRWKQKYEQIKADKEQLAFELVRSDNDLKECKDENRMLQERVKSGVTDSASSRYNIMSQSMLCKCIKEEEQFFLKREQFKNHTTLYIVQEDSDDLYSYTLDVTNRQAMQYAMNFSDLLIEGCCDVENMYSSVFTAVQIVGNSKGKVRLDGDRFIIIEKIKVRYI